MRRRSSPRTTVGDERPARREVAARQRERLLAAMAEAVAELGYEQSTVQHVLDRSGISRRTFYELFEDREDCYLALYAEGARRALAAVSDACAGRQRPAERIGSGLRAFLQLCADEPALARACVVEVFTAGAAARERRAAAMDAFAEIVRQAVGAARGDDRLDLIAARALVGAVHELIYDPIDRRDTAALPALADEIVAAHLAPLMAVGR